MKLAIFGSGNWGKNLVRNFYDILGDENIVVCDLDENKLSAMKKQFPGIDVTTNFKTLLMRRDIDAAVIATPVPFHYALARDILSAGKHVLVEKPMTMKTEEAQKLVTLAKSKKRVLMVDHLLKYHPVVDEMKQRIGRGELGEMYYLYSQRLNLGVVRTEENAMMSLGPHDVAIFLYLTGAKPVSVSANGGTYLQKDKKIEDVVLFNLEFKGGIKAYAHFSWLDPHKVRKITVVGSQKMFVFDDMDPTAKLKIFDKGAKRNLDGKSFDVRYGDISYPTIKLEEPLKRMCSHFIECIRAKKKPLTDGVEGMQVVEILSKAQESLKNHGQPIKI